MVNRDTQSSIGLLIFIAAEMMFFAGLLSSYWVLRSQIVPWPPEGQPRFPVAVTGWNTLILLASAWTVTKARYSRSIPTDRATYWLLATALGGLVFLLIQGREWLQLLDFGMRAASNVYGGIFYIVVGAHALHLIAALIALFIVCVKAWMGRYNESSQHGVRLCRMYWIFVALLWPFIYVVLYVI